MTSMPPVARKKMKRTSEVDRNAEIIPSSPIRLAISCMPSAPVERGDPIDTFRKDAADEGD